MEWSVKIILYVLFDKRYKKRSSEKKAASIFRGEPQTVIPIFIIGSIIQKKLELNSKTG